MADDALDVSKMNVRPGCKQRIMRDMAWDGRVWKPLVPLGSMRFHGSTGFPEFPWFLWFHWVP